MAMSLRPPRPRCYRSIAPARAIAVVATLLVTLSGCAGVSEQVGIMLNPGPALQAGMVEPEVLQRMGAPTSRYALPGGASRLEFAKGPYGVVTYMVDLDPAGRVTQWSQVLDQAHFDKIKKGHDKAAVLLLVGRPGVRMTESQGREAWYWRFAGYECPRYAVTFDERGRVMAPPEVLPDPACNTPAV